jgi:uncharacterized membrane protein YkvA (DUF1232 family)
LAFGHPSYRWLLSVGSSRPFWCRSRSAYQGRSRRPRRWRLRFAWFLARQHAINCSCRNPGTPRISKFFLSAGIAYAISPIDLIPDFIPVIGHLDDILIVPLLIWIAVMFIPKSVIIECREANRMIKPHNNSIQPTPTARLIFSLAAINYEVPKGGEK